MRRLTLLFSALLLIVVSSFVPNLHAQEPASISSPQATAIPLQPLSITVVVPGYTGPATLVLFDARGRFAGSVEGALSNGAGAITVLPRGALGPQWAALFVNGQRVAEAGNLFTLEARTELRTGQPRFDAFAPAVQRILSQAWLSYPLDGSQVYGYRSPDSPLIWLRDHVYQLRGARYFDPDMRTTLDAFQRYQYPDGSFPDVLPRTDYLKIDAFRTPVEADVEYLYVQGVYTTWQATGDDAWLLKHRDSMRRALTYTLQSPLRWDTARGLVKRPYTIDTWDFAYGPTTVDPQSGQPAPRHWIDDQTVWGIFHGDNTGMAQALRMLAHVEDRVGDPGLAQVWRSFADGIMRNLNQISWNGDFYTHFVPFEPLDVPGIDEQRQLSLSNAIALNRGVLTPAQGQAILAEYLRRAEQGRAFAEWYSIDPPFPTGSFGLAGRSGERPGEYVNGGIMPLVGGELAQGAFRYGHEGYGFAILDHYWQRMLTRGRSFLWYTPNGAEGVGSNDTIATDGWGASAMLSGLIEGAAGIEDTSIAYRSITVSPRWGAAGIAEAYVSARYAAGDGYVAYTWRQEERAIALQLSSSADTARVRLLLPPGAGLGKSRLQITLNGIPAPYTTEQLLGSRYAVIEATGPIVDIQARW